jgi:hypothetical protein
VSERSRAMLPIPDQSQVGLTTYDAKDPRHQVPANRATVPSRRRSERDGHLLDDIGFGASPSAAGATLRRQSASPSVVHSIETTFTT